MRTIAVEMEALEINGWFTREWKKETKVRKCAFTLSLKSAILTRTVSAFGMGRKKRFREETL